MFLALVSSRSSFECNSLSCSHFRGLILIAELVLLRASPRTNDLNLAWKPENSPLVHPASKSTRYSRTGLSLRHAYPDRPVSAPAPAPKPLPPPAPSYSSRRHRARTHATMPEKPDRPRPNRRSSPPYLRRGLPRA